MTFDPRLKIIIFLTVAATAGLFGLADPIAQDPAYHRFADRRAALGIANFLNVISNGPFVVIGYKGMRLIAAHENNRPLGSLTALYFGFFAGIFLIGCGSAYYHSHPDNQTLVWDRLPITVAMTSFFCVLIGEYVSARSARQLFIPLLILGLVSVAYWYITELSGHGDLRLYALVQFLPVILAPVILRLFNSAELHPRVVWGLLGTFAAAKIAEHLDAEIYSLLGWVSGHTLKHLGMAAGIWIVYRELRKRKDEAGTAPLRR
ncbi:ceramidase domain-containing protein [Methylosarcina fibrata]|uniref:ceramidase domain-containing protein n=1 Tax=Methylosarcina fibrata TaxID=105972 RepID=UPI0003649689|nr:ceramidase domain-containing protein [Methylosarcina fibrata]